MDDAKLFRKPYAQFDSLVQIVNTLYDGIKRWSWRKCGVLVSKKGKVINSGGIKPSDRRVTKDI